MSKLHDDHHVRIDFYTSWTCRSRLNCEACRDNPAFRERIFKRFSGVDSVDFMCVIELSEQETVSTGERVDICWRCGEFDGKVCVVQFPHETCSKKMQRFIRIGPCPLNKWRCQPVE